MKKDSITKLGLILMLICLAATLALSYTYNRTRGKIEARAKEKQIQALKVVLPQAVRFSELEKGARIDFYTAFDAADRIIGYAFPGETKGYSSVIKVMVGVDREGRITGIEMTEQKETPGLGDKTTRSPVRRTLWEALAGKGGREDVRPPFQTQFTGKLLKDLKVVVGPTDENIEAITGATISSKAVTKAVRESLELFLEQQGKK